MSTSSSASRLALAGTLALALASTLACSKVPNPFFVDEVGEGSSGETDTGSESSTSVAESTSESDATQSSTDTTTTTTDTNTGNDTDCPPSESGCPCIDGTMCFPGLTCLDGLCFAPEDCAGPSPGVVATLSYDQGGADTNCTVGATQQDGGVVLGVYGCEDMVTTLSITLSPLPAELVDILSGETFGNVRVHFEQSSRFVRLAMPGWSLWFVDANFVASGNAAVSDYPAEVFALVGECPSEPKFCNGEVDFFQRRGLRVANLPIFDANATLVDPSLHAWVDDAVVDCGFPYYRFALVDWAF